MFTFAARIINGDSHARISPAIVEKPLVVEEHQAFRKSCPCRILAAFFPGLLRLEKRLACACQSFRGSSAEKRACPSEYALAPIPDAPLTAPFLPL